MKATRTNPVLNRPAQGQNSREFLKNLEELMKRNKGGFGAMAFDTGSNQPYRVGGRVNQPNQDTPSLAWRPGEVTQPQEIPMGQFPEFEPLPEEAPGEILGNWDLSENPTPNEMLDAIFREAWSPQLPSSEQLDQRYQETGEVYPVMSNNDGTVTYNDGSVRAVDQSRPPMPIASMADGTVLWTDGFTRQMPPGGLSQYLAGVQGLSQFIFGQEQTVTQPFRNVNPGMGYGNDTHQGVDFRTRDLQQRDLYTPVPMRVVQMISAESGSPYGNSVLLELPSGEMIRLSHLSTLGQFQEGQVLNPGELIGTPGSTGNSTGEHLDVEFYNQNGQIDNPNNFRANASQYSIANEITGVSPYNQTQTQQPVQNAVSNAVEAPKQAIQAVGNTTANAIEQLNPTGQLGAGATELMRGDILGAKTELANTVNTLNPTGNIDLGITERLQGNPELANQKLAGTIANVGQQTGLPEMGISESAEQGGLTGALRQLAGNIVDTASTPLKKIGVPDFGISEAIAGDKTVNTGQNFIAANATENMSKAPVRQDYAGVLGRNLQDVSQELRGKAGEGINTLKSAGQGLKNLIGQGLQTLTPRREVGEQSSQVAQEVGETAQMSSMKPQNDVRDPFFKMGGAKMYSKYVSPNAEEKAGGALTLDLFSPDFFSNADNVANVFGGTFMGKEATDKFRSSEASKLPMSSFSPIGYGDGEWSGDYRSAVDRYNQEGKSQTDTYNKSITDYLGAIPSVLKSAFSFKEPVKPTSQRMSFGNVSKSNDKPNMSYAPQMSFARPQTSVTPKTAPVPTPKPQMSFARNMPQMSVAPKPQMSPAPVAPPRPAPQPRPTLQDYLSRGKTKEQYYAETGQQSTLDDMNRNPWNYTGSQMSVGSQQGVSNAINAAASGNQYVSPSGNTIPNYTPANANMTDASTGLPVVGKPAPYPIATMADGRKRYSDGSIR